MSKIKCGTCGEEFDGMEGKEDTCPKCMKRVLEGEEVGAYCDKCAMEMEYDEQGNCMVCGERIN